nr:esterase [Cyanobium sp. LEGE 06143]
MLRRGPSSADRRLVLLHGWGADADDLLDLADLLVDSDTSVVALRAPGLHPSGMGRQWYDLQQSGWPELPGALENLRQRLEDLGQEVPLGRTVLLGFSQGAAMALDVSCGGAGLAVAGVVACSGYPHPDWQPGGGDRPGGAGGHGFPVLLTHGQQDQVVPYAASVELARLLSAGGHGVELLGFPGGHTIDMALIPSIRSAITDAWMEA